MGRLKMAIVAAGLALVGTLSGCPASHDDYPGSSCKVDNDCFKGERCMNSICVAITPPPDLSVVVLPGDMAGVVDMTDIPDQSTGADL